MLLLRKRLSGQLEDYVNVPVRDFDCRFSYALGSVNMRQSRVAEALCFQLDGSFHYPDGTGGEERRRGAGFRRWGGFFPPSLVTLRRAALARPVQLFNLRSSW